MLKGSKELGAAGLLIIFWFILMLGLTLLTSMAFMYGRPDLAANIQFAIGLVLLVLTLLNKFPAVYWLAFAMLYPAMAYLLGGGLGSGLIIFNFFISGLMALASFKYQKFAFPTNA